jgi:penicillin amidase
VAELPRSSTPPAGPAGGSGVRPGPPPGAADLAAALPDLRSPLSLPGLDGPVDVWRDPDGVPHARASTTHDAFFAQGFVHAQDRLWHMEYDRRRAAGRWAECVGPTGVAQDTLARRLGLLRSARADYDAVGTDTRAMLDAYAAGVNAFLDTTAAWPVECTLLGIRPERWAPWDSLAVFKIRHVEMGPWQAKLWRARLARQLGPRLAARLCPGHAPNPALILPPGAEHGGPGPDGLAAFADAGAALDSLPAWLGGSNSWAVAGARTASGRPLVAGDPHRALEVPNCYYQNHVACPEFDAIGLSFPGVPGFPHFGHTRQVAWCVTHAMADYQDLFVERFDPADPTRYAFRGEWRAAETRRETIAVRGATPVTITVTATHHGPVVLGDPARGHAVALRYTATAEPNRTFDAVLAMLRAGSAAEIEAAMRPWVDPGNNFVFADVRGTIGYRTRGAVPVRAAANAWVPVPGWDGAHEWRGVIPFDELPATRDPATGWLATANARIAGADYPHYLGLDHAPDFRTRRLVARLRDLRGATPADMAAIHADRISVPARALLPLLDRVRPLDEPSRAALEVLRGWDGAIDRDQAAPTVYAALRERLVRDLLAPRLGPLAADAFAPVTGAPVAHMGRLRGRLAEWIRDDDRTLLPPGDDWPAAIARALAGAVGRLRDMLGDDPAGWAWGRVHAARPRHPLSALHPELADRLDPPPLALGGDADTVQAAAYVLAAGFDVTLTSVARYVFDLADWERSAWIVPLGASGHPGSPHYADQARDWADVRLRPMRYGWARIAADAESHQRLTRARAGA